VSLYISGALGLAVLGAVATDHTRGLVAHGDSASHALASGYQLAFGVAAAVVAAGLAVAMVVLRASSVEREPAVVTARS
jgi:hypothetical protein